MYFLFRFHHKKPSEIYWLPLGEKRILHAFMRYEMEQRKEEIER